MTEYMCSSLRVWGINRTSWKREQDDTKESVLSTKHMLSMIPPVFIKFPIGMGQKWHPPAVDSWCFSLAWTRRRRRLRGRIIGALARKTCKCQKFRRDCLTGESTVFKRADKSLSWIWYGVSHAKASKNSLCDALMICRLGRCFRAHTLHML